MTSTDERRAQNYIGRGIYPIREAARLTGVPASSITRWLSGYDYNYRGAKRRQPPVFLRDFEDIEGRKALSFLDVVEVRFVGAFRKHGVSWRAIRLAATNAAELLESPHPFALHRFYTDRKNIFARIAKDTDNDELLNLVTDQYEMDRLIEPTLFEVLEFNEQDLATRWWPRGKSGAIVIDPRRNFGRPTVARCGIATRVLAESARGAESTAAIAAWYDIDERDVIEAIEFESNLAA